jgi:K+-transporting ATPase ATPase C chain
MKTILISLRMLLLLTALNGVVYPITVTLLAKALFARQANGSLVSQNRQVIGSELLAQRFTEERYFWPRPSAGGNGANYVTVPSLASNKGPTSGELKTNVQNRAIAFRQAHSLTANATVPADMIFACGSGLDPHISPEAARLQIKRVAATRNFDDSHTRRVAALVEQYVEPPQLGFLGDPRVNVLKLNLALDSLK